MIRLLLAVAALLALATSGRAHETTRSYLGLDREGAAVSARLRLAFRDVEVVAWMDEDLDGRITWGEARARLEEARSYAAARVSLAAGGACPLVPDGEGVSRTAGLDYLDLTFSATCPDPSAPLSIATTLFAEIDPGHRLFLTVSDGGGVESTIVGTGDAATEVGPDATGPPSFLAYLQAGAEHLLAGADHLVFLLVLILPAIAAPGPLRARALGVLAAVTGFTIAHALTLAAAATEILRPPAALIESLIALSILVTAVDNVWPFIPGPRTALAAFFGTIHGFGFATALSGLSLTGSAFAVALLGFNLGIEAAQVGVVLLAMPALAMLGRGPWVLRIGSAAAAALALVWLWQRLPQALGLA